MTFHLDSNTVKVKSEKKGLRLTTNTGDNLLLANVSPEETQDVVTKNYLVVKSHFEERARGKIEAPDLEKVSLKIVLHYFYMYQMWRSLYDREKNRDLTFIPKDFEHPYTTDTVISYFKSAYPKAYAVKCQIMLAMSADKFSEYEKNRQAFFDLR